jgi:NAD(P)-dependent dehydrogenase (short-subunit alcohol dehydrogenase family)
MSLRFAEKVVVLTGGGSGIGKAAVDAFVAEGARVVVGDRNTEALSGIDHVIALQMDLLEVDAPARLVDAALHELGRVDIVVNDVGGAVAREDFLDTTEESWDWHLDLNLKTAVRTTRAALPAMLERGQGAVVSVTSDAGRSPLTFFSEYSAAKAALRTWSKCLSKLYGPKGIRFNTVAPGPTRTPTFLGTLERELAPAWGVSVDEATTLFVESRNIALGRIAEPSEIADSILFLASEDARMVTGIEILVDGGSSTPA